MKKLLYILLPGLLMLAACDIQKSYVSTYDDVYYTESPTKTKSDKVIVKKVPAKSKVDTLYSNYTDEYAEDSVYTKSYVNNDYDYSYYDDYDMRMRFLYDG
jgi:hypothetical protein